MDRWVLWAFDLNGKSRAQAGEGDIAGHRDSVCVSGQTDPAQTARDSTQPTAVGDGGTQAGHFLPQPLRSHRAVGAAGRGGAVRVLGRLLQAEAVVRCHQWTCPGHRDQAGKELIAFVA